MLSGKVTSAPASALTGEVTAPGDKSISHRALIFGALAEGESILHGLLEGDDVLRTAAAMRQFGARVDRRMTPDGAEWRVIGAPWQTPDRPIYFGNSGTGVRLVMGAAAGQGVGAVFEGDESLRHRPMGRIIDPLKDMGAVFESHEGKLPVSLTSTGARGGKPLHAIDYALPVPSAQVKSAILLAGLGAQGRTVIREPEPCRDHTERMLSAFGVHLDHGENDGVRTITMEGGQKLTATSIDAPGDPSSAAFPVAAAVITPGSDVVVRNVLLNPLRIGLFETLQEMGAEIVYENERMASGERVGDIRARYSPRMSGVAVPASRAPSMIDEYPILSIIAAFASGDTYMPGIGELRVKESDRIAATEALLKANGVETDSAADWLRVTGLGKAPSGGGVVVTHADHRIAMSALVLGCGAENPVTIDEAAMIGTSFPTFANLMARLGGRLSNS